MANTVLPMPRHVEIAYKDPSAVLGSMKRISATQLTLIFSIFFAIFLDSTGQIFLRFRKNFSLS
jgi:hypothetical protein